MNATCKNCEHPVDAAPLVFTDARLPALTALFRGELDDLRCPTCGYPTGIRPTVEFVSLRPPAHFAVAGTGESAQQGNVAERIRDSFRAYGLRVGPQIFPDMPPDVSRKMGDLFGTSALGFDIQVLPDLAALRNAVAQQLNRNIDAIFAHIAAEANGQDGALGALNASNFCAVFLAFFCPEAGLGFTAEDDQGAPVEPAAALARLAQIQADSWCDFWRALCRSAGHLPNLELELSLRFADQVILPGAAEIAVDELARLAATSPLSLHDEYCLHALRASICAYAGIENAERARWTALFFMSETALRSTTKPSGPRMRSLIISETRARATVSYHDAFAEVKEIVRGRPPTLHGFGDLEEIVAKLGHAGMVDDVLMTINAELADQLPLDAIIEFLGFVLAENDGAPYAASCVLASVSERLIDENAVDQAEKMADDAIALAPESPAMRAEVFAWLGSVMTALRMPGRLLDRIGDADRDWEDALDDGHKAALWTERSNALRMVGRIDEALDLVDRVLEVVSDEKGGIDRCVARLNRAILLRQSGAPDSSLEELEDLLALPEVKGRLRIDVFNSLALANLALGRTAEAATCHERALRLATGPLEDQLLKMRINWAASLAADERFDEAAHILTSVDAQIGPKPIVLFPAVSAWLTILKNSQLAPHVGFDKVRMAKFLAQVAERAQAARHIPDWIDALRMLACMSELIDHPRARQLWQQVADIGDVHSQPVSPDALLALARFAYLSDENSLALRHLVQLPRSLAAAAGRAVELGAVAESVALQIQRRLDDLLRVALDKARSVQEIRLLAEVRRDVVTRSQSYAEASAHPASLGVLGNVLSDAALAALAPEHGRLGVLEWIECPEWHACLFTVIDSAKAVRTLNLKYPDVDLAGLAVKISSRLNGWTSRRPGDPFDLEEWHELEAWLVRELSPYLQPDDHLVVFERGAFAGLPWHVAASSHWSCSYAAGWTALLSMHSSAVRKPVAGLGVISVHQHGDAKEVIASFQESRERSRVLAERLGLTLISRDGAAGDRHGLAEALANTEVCKLLCHGIASKSGHEVALVLAHDGMLPPANSIVDSGVGANRHRFSWRDARRLKHASPVVFSAGCSTGAAHMVGVGERVSLLSGLRNAGTRSLVAPRWEAVSESFLPILDESMTFYLGGMTLAAAIRAACSKAEQHSPRWLAWTISIEGEWQ